MKIVTLNHTRIRVCINDCPAINGYENLHLQSIHSIKHIYVPEARSRARKTLTIITNLLGFLNNLVIRKSINILPP